MQTACLYIYITNCLIYIQNRKDNLGTYLDMHTHTEIAGVKIQGYVHGQWLCDLFIGLLVGHTLYILHP